MESMEPDFDGGGCGRPFGVIAVAAILTFVYFAFAPRMTEAVRTFALGTSSTPAPPTATPTRSPVPEPEPVICPAAAACTWSEDEIAAVSDWKARILPVARDLTQVAGKIRALDTALRTDTDGTLRDNEWRRFARETWTLLDDAVVLLGSATPGSTAGTHARLLYAAAILQECRARHEFIRGFADASSARLDNNSAFLTCDLDVADSELLMALTALGTLK